MKHPQVLLLPFLMISDYLLTVLGAVLREKGYSNHFKMDQYEMNPLWQESIGRKRWLNFRHILLTLVMTCGLAWLLEFGAVSDSFAESLFGCLFVVFGMVIGRHLSNILIFRRFARRPGEVSGQVVLAHSLTLAISTCQFFVVAIPVAMIAVFRPTPFALGGMAGIVLVLAVHGIWILRNRKRPSKPQI